MGVGAFLWAIEIGAAELSENMHERARIGSP